jgi:hypothetical protein
MIVEVKVVHVPELAIDRVQPQPQQVVEPSKHRSRTTLHGDGSAAA